MNSKQSKSTEKFPWVTRTWSQEPGLLPEPQPPEDVLALGRVHTSTSVAFPQRLDGFFGLLLPSWGLASQCCYQGYQQAGTGWGEIPPSFPRQNRPRHHPAAALFLPGEPDQMNNCSAVTIMMMVECVDCLYRSYPIPPHHRDH